MEKSSYGDNNAQKQTTSVTVSRKKERHPGARRRISQQVSTAVLSLAINTPQKGKKKVQ